MQIAVLASLVCLMVSCSAKIAGKTLRMLAVVPFTGNAPRDGLTCEAAMQVAVNWVNTRDDILPGYTLDVVYKDEGENGRLAPQQFVNFLRQNEEPVSQNGSMTILAPVYVGNLFSCNNVARAVRAQNMVEFATQCGSVVFTANRKNYPNLYRNKVSYDSLPFAQILFMRNVGHWIQIGLLSYGGNQNQLYNALAYYKAAISLDIDVLWFAYVQDVTSETITSLQSTDVRVLVILFTETIRLVKFLCYSYQMGVRGEHYAFFALPIVFFDPNSSEVRLPQGCTPKMVMEQYKITIWLGPLEEAFQSSGKTSLGYDMQEFEAMLDKLTNSSRTPDYIQRHRCHDTMEQAIITMNNSISNLATRYNSSLEDFAKDSVKVMNVVNQSAAELDIVGLRIGRMKYSERLELDYEALYASQWINGAMRYTHNVTYRGQDASGVFNISAYHLSEYRKVQWWTASKDPPKDLSKMQHFEDDMPSSILYILIALSGAFLTCQFGAFAILSNRKGFWKVEWRKHIFAIVGGLVLNIASIVIAIDLHLQRDLLCVLKPILIVVGMSLQNGAVFCRMTLLNTYAGGSFFRNRSTRAGTARRTLTGPNRSPGRSLKSAATPMAARRANHGTHELPSLNQPTPNSRAQNMQSTGTPTTARRGNGTNGTTISQQPKAIVVAAKSTAFSRVLVEVGTCLFLAINVLALGLWLGIFAPVRFETIVSPKAFNDKDNFYYDVTTSVCKSDFRWEIAFAAVHAVLMMSNAFSSYQLHRVTFEDTLQVEFKFIRLAALNQLTLSLATILILTTVEKYSAKGMVLACGVFLFGCSTTMVATLPAFY